MSVPDRRVPLGKPLSSTDADLDKRAAITPESIAEAAAWWRRHAPKAYRGLLQAIPDDPESS